MLRFTVTTNILKKLLRRPKKWQNLGALQEGPVIGEFSMFTKESGAPHSIKIYHFVGDLQITCKLRVDFLDYINDSISQKVHCLAFK